jgi:ribosomal subunit interface protein
MSEFEGSSGIAVRSEGSLAGIAQSTIMRGEDKSVMTETMSTRFLIHGIELTGKQRIYILKRLSVVEKLVDPVSHVEVEVGQNKKKQYRVEVMIHDPQVLYRAEKLSESIEGSIDMVVEKLSSEVIRGKEKFRDLSRRGARSIKKKTTLDKSARF